LRNTGNPLHKGGFTLLEMLFVLMVIGLLSGLVIPRFANSYQRKEAQAQREGLEAQLRELPRRVRLMGRPIVLPAESAIRDLGDGKAPFDVPEGWKMAFAPPLEISIMGVCSGSTVELENLGDPSLSVRLAVARGSCDIAAI